MENMTYEEFRAALIKSEHFKTLVEEAKQYYTTKIINTSLTATDEREKLFFAVKGIDNLSKYATIANKRSKTN